jgi:capsular polysaccharide biosynthesis protein
MKGAGNVTISAPISVDARGATPGDASQIANQVSTAFENKIRQVMANEMRPGGLFNG